jgi:formate hydrogenlyase transcriptional activator
MELKPQKSPLGSPSSSDPADHEAPAPDRNEQQEQFHQMADNIQEIFWLIDAVTKQAIYVNRAFEQITGRTRASLQEAPLSYREIIHPDDRAHVLGRLDEAQRTGKFDEEFRITRPDGDIRWVWTRGFPIRDAEGNIYRLAGVVQDVTERRNTQEALSRFAAIVESSDDAIISKDLNGIITSWNAGAQRIFGYTEAEVLGKPITTLIPPEMATEENLILARLRAGEVIQHYETIRVTKTGNKVHVSLTVSPLKDSNGRVVGASKIARDITQQKRAEHALRESEDRYRDLVEHSRDLLCTHDLSGRLLSANPAPARLLGYSVEELMQIPMRELIAPETRELFDEYLARIQRYGAAEGLLILVTRTGERRIWEYHNTLRSEGLPFPIVRGMAHDVTERRQAEHELRKSEERFRVALKNSPTVVFNQDSDLRYTWIHSSTLAWAEKGYLGKTDAEILGTEDAHRLTEVKRRVLETGVAKRTVIDIAFQGRTLFYDLTIEPLCDRTGAVAGITCAATDITELHEKTQRLQLLLEINSSLVSKLELQDLFPAISSCLQRLFNQDFASVSVYDAQHQIMHTYPLDVVSAKRLVDAETYVRVHESLTASALQDREIKFFRRTQIAALGSGFTFLGDDIRSLCCIPIESYSKDPVATLNLGSTLENAFTAADFFLMKQVGTTMSVALDNARAYGELGQLNEKLEEQKRHLERELSTELHFEEIIGESPALKQCMALAEKVAGGDSTVLILGEAGTGKELLARAIHRMSARSQNTFIKLNCAAIPPDLLESELFGHEKGAFTGAVRQKPGRFELAENGTLFLDEVGEIPLALQPKLLRVLQDQEFERLGGTRTLRANVRVIAATNRDLIKNVAERQFRSDLFYRLNVFPIRLPALRERRSDIPLLITHFVQRHASRLKKQIKSTPIGTIDALTSWDWPGNIRELENFIERSVILTEGPGLKAPLAELGPTFSISDDNTLEAREREHIIRMLRETGGVLGGKRGAAARLGLKRSTLQSKLHRLGISREQYQARESA